MPVCRHILQRFVHICSSRSQFSQGWDLVQIAMLLYVTVVVPMRSGIVDRAGDSLLEVLPFSVSWWIDLFVDIYFWADL